MNLRKNCRQQKEVGNLIIETKLSNKNPLILAGLIGLFERIIGCQTHEHAAPCGNKEQRGVPRGGNCTKCPLENDVFHASFRK